MLEPRLYGADERRRVELPVVDEERLTPVPPRTVDTRLGRVYEVVRRVEEDTPERVVAELLREEELRVPTTRRPDVVLAVL